MKWQNYYQFSGKVIKNGDGECSTLAASLGGSVAQADRLGPYVDGRPALVLHSPNKPDELSQWILTLMTAR